MPSPLPPKPPVATTAPRTSSIRTPAYEALIARLRIETAARRLQKPVRF